MLLLLLLLSFHPAVHHPSLLALCRGQRQLPIYRHIAAGNHFCRSQSVLWNHDATWGKLLPMCGKGEKRGEQANSRASILQDRRVTGGISCSSFAHLLSKLKGSFMVIPKNLKTLSFARFVTVTNEIPKRPAKCKVRFFRNKARWIGVEEVFLPDWFIDTRRWGATRSSPSVCVSIYPDKSPPFSSSDGRGIKYLAALNDTAISLASFALACAAMETY